MDDQAVITIIGLVVGLVGIGVSSGAIVAKEGVIAVALPTACQHNHRNLAEPVRRRRDGQAVLFCVRCGHRLSGDMASP